MKKYLSMVLIAGVVLLIGGIVYFAVALNRSEDKSDMSEATLAEETIQDTNNQDITITEEETKKHIMSELEETDKDIEMTSDIMYITELADIPPMKNRAYAEWDGKIYYRQYSDADFSKGELWGYFENSVSTEKPLMCMDEDGEVTQVGVDMGCGSMYIVNGRLYSQRNTGEEYQAYSGDLNGENVVDLNACRILDVAGNTVICELKNGYGAVDAQSGKVRVLWMQNETWEDYTYLGTDGEQLFFYTYLDEKQENLVLKSVTMNGNLRDIKTLTREEYENISIEYDGEEYYEYPMKILDFQIIGDTLYFSVGSFNGSGHMYSGGPIYSMNKDGSDCRIIAYGDFYFYYYEDEDNRCIFFNPFGSVEYLSSVVLQGEEPIELYVPNIYHCFNVMIKNDDMLGKKEDVVFYPDHSGRCYKLLSEEECRANSIDFMVDGSQKQQLYDMEYLNGKLFFRVTDVTYNRDESIGWRDYYDRGRTRVFCKDLKSGEISVLYEY